LPQLLSLPNPNAGPSPLAQALARGEALAKAAKDDDKTGK
jgi:hypothetical protein